MAERPKPASALPPVVLMARNTTRAALGYDSVGSSLLPTVMHASSLTVGATKHRIDMKAPSFADVKNLKLEAFDPSTYLSSHNYYTEAIAGAASKGNAAVSGALAVNVFSNVTDASIGDMSP